MERDSLTLFIEDMRNIWGSLDTDLIAKSRASVEKLASAPRHEEWLQRLQGQFDESRELYRDPDHGFLLLAHTEAKGKYRAPHDHGLGWVIYVVQRGVMEMGIYELDPKDETSVHLRDSYRMNAGEARIFLPGDIHDTRCISESLLMLRLTSCDLRTEMRMRRMHQYVSSK